MRSLRLIIICLLSLLFPRVLWAGEPDGQTLAQQIRSIEPVEDSSIRGSLQIRMKKKRVNIPFVCKVVRRDSKWETVFKAGPTPTDGAETLVVVHDPSGPNQYLYGKAAAPNDAIPALAPISPEKAATTPFAGSDFSLGDLGLDFLFWPLQQRLKSQTRLDRLCYVLESGNDRATEIVRVRSFIDTEYSGSLGAQGFPALLVAEAYDNKNEMVKKFSLHGSSFKKVNGQYRLKKMEISNEKSGSQTTIEYDLTE